MALPDSLQDFLRRKHETGEQAGKVDWPGRLAKWQDAVHALYGNVEAWLSPSIVARHVEVSRRHSRVTEEFIGSYSIESLILTAGAEVVTLEPLGTLIVGGNGRVDVRGSNGDGMLILDKDWEWSITNRTPRRTQFRLTEESFAELLRQVMKP